MNAGFDRFSMVLIAVAGTAMALASSPAPVEAQTGYCGECVGEFGIAHVFTSITPAPIGDRRCDNSGGCHFTWYLPGCGVHFLCGSGAGGSHPDEQPTPCPECGGDNLEDVLGMALQDGDRDLVKRALESVEGWKVDEERNVLYTLNCSGTVMARFEMPDHPLPMLTKGDASVVVSRD